MSNLDFGQNYNNKGDKYLKARTRAKETTSKKDSKSNRNLRDSVEKRENKKIIKKNKGSFVGRTNVQESVRKAEDSVTRQRKINAKRKKMHPEMNKK